MSSVKTLPSSIFFTVSGYFCSKNAVISSVSAFNSLTGTSFNDVLEVSEEQAKVNGRVPVGAILVDGLGVGDVGNVVLRDRQHLAEDGIMIVVMSLDKASGELVAGPDIVSRGFVYVKESDELIEEARRTVDDALQACLDKGITDWGKLKTTTKDVLGDYVWKKTKRRPMILPIIMEV